MEILDEIVPCSFGRYGWRTLEIELVGELHHRSIGIQADFRHSVNGVQACKGDHHTRESIRPVIFIEICQS